jgi:hypothetical protein
VVEVYRRRSRSNGLDIRPPDAYSRRERSNRLAAGASCADDDGAERGAEDGAGQAGVDGAGVLVN